MRGATLQERIEAKIDRTMADGCWPWLGGTGQLGQPTITLKKRTLSARRAYYEITRTNGLPLPKERWVTMTCGNQGCMRPAHMKLRANRDIVARFWQQVKKGNGDTCWLWAGYVNPRGYGQFHPRDGAVRPAHRVAYELENGPIPDDGTEWCVCHHCDNPRCVRPDHLFLGRDKDNHDDMVRKGRHAHGPRLREAMRRARERKMVGQPESDSNGG